MSEAGLYKLIFTSRKAEALEFQDYVTSVILPAVRKTGGFNMQGGRYCRPPLAEPTLNQRLVAADMRTQPLLARCTLIRTADLVLKNPALMHLWDATGMPRLPLGRIDELAEERGHAVLERIMLAACAGGCIKDVLAQALNGSDAAAELLEPLGFVAREQEEGVVIANDTPFLRNLFKGRETPFWRDLRQISNAEPYRRLRFGGHQSRGTFLPIREIEELCSFQYEGLFETVVA